MSYRQQAATCGRGARGQLSEIPGPRLMHQNPIVQALFGEYVKVKSKQDNNRDPKAKEKCIQDVLH